MASPDGEGVEAPAGRGGGRLERGHLLAMVSMALGTISILTPLYLLGGAALIGLAAIVTGMVARFLIAGPSASRTMRAQAALGTVLGVLGVVAGLWMVLLGYGLEQLGGGGA